MDSDKIHIGLIKIFLPLILALKSLGGNFFELISLEAQLAKRNIIRIILFAILLIVLLPAVWVCLLTLLIIWLLSLGMTLPIIILGVLLCHTVIILLIVIMIMRAMRHVTFAATRRQLRKIYEKT